MNKSRLLPARVATWLFAVFSVSILSAAAPEDLSPSEWSSLRAAYDAARQRFFPSQDGTHHAQNLGQGWSTSFDARGFMATPDQGGWQWGLELKSFEIGGWEIEAKAGLGETTQDGRRLSFQRAPLLEEWFLNDASGLEQGWTVSARPDSAGPGPLRLELAVRGGLNPMINEAGVAFLDGSGAAVVNYNGLKAWDATGRSLPARFVATEGGFAVEVDERGARYPVVIDPLAQQAYLKPSNTDANDRFGWSVAVSGDTVVIGAIYEDSAATGVNGDQASNGLSESGAAYVFVRQGGHWVQQAYLKASNPGLDDEFGCAVAISGNTIVVGARREDSSSPGINGIQANEGTSGSGAAYVFVRTGWVWAQQAYLKASNPQTNASFGDSVAISGNTIAIGAAQEASDSTGINGPQNNTNAGDSGAVYVFTRTRTTWTQQAYVKSSNSEASDFFGGSVALSGDTLVAGAYGERSNATGINGNQADNSLTASGAAYVFQRTGSTWTQQAYLKASNPEAEDRFGLPVAISGDTIVAAAWTEDSDANGVNGDQGDNTATDAGAAYVFELTGGTWRQSAYLKASNSGMEDRFGFSLAVSGSSIAVGAYQEDGDATGFGGADTNNASNAGAVYFYTRNAGQWILRSYIKAADTVTLDLFGHAVAMSGDLLVVGAPEEDSESTGVNGNAALFSASNSGAVYTFTGMAPVYATLAKSGESAPGAPDIAFGSPGVAALSDESAIVIFDAGLTGSGATLGRNRGMFAQYGSGVDLLLQTKDGLGGFGAGFVPGQFALAVSNPCVNQASKGTLFQATASGPGITTANKTALLRDNGSFLTLLSRTGRSVMELSGATPSVFSEVLQSFDTDLVAIPLQLQLSSSPSVTPSTDSALLPLDHDGLVLAATPVREGDSAIMFTGNADDKLGQLTGRGSSRSGDVIHFTASLLEPLLPSVNAVFRVAKDASAGILAYKGGVAAPGTTPATFFSSFPGISDNGTHSIVRAMVSGQPKSMNEGIWGGGKSAPLERS